MPSSKRKSRRRSGSHRTRSLKSKPRSHKRYGRYGSTEPLLQPVLDRVQQKMFHHYSRCLLPNGIVYKLFGVNNIENKNEIFKANKRLRTTEEDNANIQKYWETLTSEWKEKAKTIVKELKTFHQKKYGDTKSIVVFFDGDPKRLSLRRDEWVVHPWQHVVEALTDENEKDVKVLALKDGKVEKADQFASVTYVEGGWPFNTIVTSEFADHLLYCNMVPEVKPNKMPSESEWRSHIETLNYTIYSRNGN